jgi:glycosyltransferase involved in cell wall biosynthesis
LDLLTDLLSGEKKIIFMVNYPSVLPLVKELKKRFDFPVISVIHSATWQLLTIGNKQKFIEVWNNREKYDFNTIKELAEEKELYELADHIVSVTSYMKRFVTEYYDIPEKKITVIINGMDISGIKIPDVIERKKIKEQLGFKADEKIIVFSGRLDKGKGLHFLLQAFNEVFRQDKNVNLIIIGEDSGMEKISEFLTFCKDSWRNVVFTGFLKQEYVHKFYRIADVGILPSVYDHCPFTALEMMAYNIPLIISNTEGLNEMLNENQAHYINPVYDSEGNISFNINEVANAMLSLLYDDKKIKLLIKDYPQLLKNKFSSIRMAGQMHELLNSLKNTKEIVSERMIN